MGRSFPLPRVCVGGPEDYGCVLFRKVKGGSMCRFFRLLSFLFVDPIDRPKDEDRRNNDDEDDGALFV